MNTATDSQSSIVRDAGPFLSWLHSFRESLLGTQGTEVACGECVGCCVSSYSILVRPQDTPARRAIPHELLVDAPSLGKGMKVMGYYVDGTCPMLRGKTCSIYADRPQTCRDYDCRVFSAAGLDAGGPEKKVINTRVREWQFTYPTSDDRAAHDAVRAAASFIQTHTADFPGGRAPTTPSGIAVLATKVYSLFIATNATARASSDLANDIIRLAKEFDSKMPT